MLNQQHKEGQNEEEKTDGGGWVGVGVDKMGLRTGSNEDLCQQHNMAKLLTDPSRIYLMLFIPQELKINK